MSKVNLEKQDRLTHCYVKSILDYNPETGELARKSGEKAGGLQSGGYRCIGMFGKKYLVHRVIYFIMTGKWPDQIDHINHNRSDNRWENLRNVSSTGNARNISITTRNKTGMVGVNWRPDRNRWTANIRINNKLLHIYDGDSLFEAVCARKMAEIKYGFHPNHGK